MHCTIKKSGCRDIHKSPKNGAVYDFHGFIQPMFDSTNARTKTPVQFTDGYDIPRGPIGGHGDRMAPIPGQRLFSGGPSLTWKKSRSS